MEVDAVIVFVLLEGEDVVRSDALVPCFGGWTLPAVVPGFGLDLMTDAVDLVGRETHAVAEVIVERLERSLFVDGPSSALDTGTPLKLN